MIGLGFILIRRYLFIVFRVVEGFSDLVGKDVFWGRCRVLFVIERKIV